MQQNEKPSPEQKYTVKPLEWTEHKDPYREGFTAKDHLYTYTVKRERRLPGTKWGAWQLFIVDEDMPDPDVHDVASAEAGKAMVEDTRNEMLLSELNPVEDPPTQETYTISPEVMEAISKTIDTLAQVEKHYPGGIKAVPTFHEFYTEAVKQERQQKEPMINPGLMEEVGKYQEAVREALNKREARIIPTPGPTHAERQAKERDIRFSYHHPVPGQPEKYQRIRDTAKSLAKLIEEESPESREQSLAITKLEEATFWANAAIARRS
jgi:hypothetical protein